MTTTTQDRGQWSSKLGFILAAAGSAVGLGNIWKFPSEVAENGGAAFLLIYLICCFAVGFPVMIAELTIGRHTRKNPVGAYRIIGGSRAFGLIGIWGILCGFMILAFYNVVAGWTLGYVFGELAHFIGWSDIAAQLMNIGLGPKNAIFSSFFMLATIFIVANGVSSGIERAARTLMPMLIGILLIMIGYVLTKEGSAEGLAAYLRPDVSHLNANLIFSAMGQSFFSLSLGMGALITYGSYLKQRENIPQVAAFVTLADVGIAFLAGLLIMPTMYMAQNSGIEIFDANGALINSTGLVFNVLPALFNAMGGVGLFFALAFFVLLSMAALTSTISLLEVPTCYAIDEHGLPRKKAAWIIGILIGVLSLIVSFNLNLIGVLDVVFNQIGLPLGGMMICLILAYVWKITPALAEIKSGYAAADQGLFSTVWPVFMRFICPILIAIVFVTTLINLL